MKFISSILLLLVVISCSKTNTVTITGKVTNPTDSTIFLSVGNNPSIDTISILANDGSFITAIKVEEPSRASLKHGCGWMELYLVPGSSINLNFDGKELNNHKRENITLSGKGNEGSQFLLDYSILSSKRDIGRHVLSPLEFDKIEKQYLQKLNNRINEFESSNPEEKELSNIKRMNTKILSWNHYKFYLERFKDNNIDTIPGLRKIKTYADSITNSIPIDNYGMFKESGDYQHFVCSHYLEKFQSKLNKEGLSFIDAEYTNKKIDLIKKLNVPQIVKDELGYWMIKPYLQNDAFFIREPDEKCLKIIKMRYFEIVTNEKYIQEFKKI